MIELCNNCGAGLPCDCGYVPGAPRNPPLPDNSLSEAFVQTQAKPDAEKLLSDALTHEGNDSVWAYTGLPGRSGRGSFTRFSCGDNLAGWQIPPTNKRSHIIWDQREFWFRMLQEDELTLVSPPSVSAPGIQPTEDATQTGTKPEGAL